MRLPRYYYESNFYHVMSQGDEKKFIFDSDECKRKIIGLLKKNAKRNNIQLISYCIMGNHYHALLYAPKTKDLSKMMNQTNTSYGIFFSKKRDNVGHVFRDRFRSESIYTKDHLINCIKYIHANPVKANMCNTENDYPYSSYDEFKKIDEQIQSICNITKEDINSIINPTPTITLFIDDEYCLEDIYEYYRSIKYDYEDILDNAQKTALLYENIKRNCRANDTTIAKMMGIDRKTLLSRLKKCGIKKMQDELKTRCNHLK